MINDSTFISLIFDIIDHVIISLSCSILFFLSLSSIYHDLRCCLVLIGVVNVFIILLFVFIEGKFRNMVLRILRLIRFFFCFRFGFRIARDWIGSLCLVMDLTSIFWYWTV